MLINLSKLLSGDQEKLIEQVTLEMDAFACSLGTFPVTGKQRFPLTITKIGTDKFLFEGETLTARFAESPDEAFVFAFIEFFAGELINKKVSEFLSSASEGNFLSNLKHKGKQIFAPVLEGKLE